MVLRATDEVIEKDLQNAWHGSTLRNPGPFGDQEKAEAFGKAVTDSIDRGLAALRAGSPFAPDVTPQLGPDGEEQVTIFELFDVFSGEHILCWRVNCRELTPAEMAAREAKDKTAS